MSRRFIFLALLLVSVCWTSTCEAQLFRRGATRPPNQAYYPQQQYARQATQSNCGRAPGTRDSQAQANLFVLPNGRYAVRRDGRYYYAQPSEIQATFQQQQMRRNAYAEQMYGQQANQAERIQSANGRANATRQNSTVAAPTPDRAVLRMQTMRPITLPPSNAMIVVEDGPYFEGPAIVGPVLENELVPTTAPTSQNVIKQVDGMLPVGTIPPAADIPTTDGIPIGGASEDPESFSVLEKNDGDK